MQRRHFLALPAAAMAPRAGRAQTYPARPVRILSSAPPGGASDVVARLVADGFSAALEARFIVENRPGAGGTIAAEAAARAAPDGHTLFMGILSTQVLLPAMRRVPYDAEHGFVPIGLISNSPMVLVVHPAVPARTLAELLTLSRNASPPLNFSNGGIGTLPHLLHEMMARRTGLLAQPVPYSGSATALQAVVAGEVAGAFEVGVIVRGQVRAGALRALAVTTPERDPGLPDVPTLAEAGFADIQAGSWTALFAPVGTPDAIVRTLSRQLVALGRSPPFGERLATLGAMERTGTPEQLAAFLAEERARWTDLARSFAGSLP